MDTSNHSIRFGIYGSAILLSLVCLSQLSAQTYRFYPDWAAGTKKTLTISTSQDTYVNDELSESSSTTTTAEIHVLSTDDSGPTIETLYKDVSLRAAIKGIEDLGGHLDVENLRIVNHLNRETGELSLDNYEEVKDYHKKTLHNIRNAYFELDPEIGQLMEVALKSMEAIYEDEKSIKEMMDKEVYFVYGPFKQGWEIGKAYVEQCTQTNPLTQEGEMKGTLTTTLRSVDASTAEAIFEQSIEFDMTQMKEIMMDMIIEMWKSMAPEEELTEEKMAELRTLFDMKMNFTQKVHFDTKTNWVNSATTTIIVENTNQGRLSRAVNTSTAVIR